MKYQVKIIEHGEKEQTERGEYQRGICTKTADNEEGWGYTPSTQEMREYNETIFDQTVDSLDIASTIAVINGLPLPQIPQRTNKDE